MVKAPVTQKEKAEESVFQVQQVFRNDNIIIAPELERTKW